MRKRIRVAKLVSLGIVFVFTLSVLIGCGGVSIKVIEKQNILGDEIVTAYVSNFKNEDATWQKLQNFGDNFDKNVDYLTIYFFNDRNKIPKLKSLEFLSLDASSEGVVAVYERYGGEGSLDKNPDYENTGEEGEEESSQNKGSENTNEPVVQPVSQEPKEELVQTNIDVNIAQYGERLTATSIRVIKSPSNPGVLEIQGDFVYSNTYTKNQTLGELYLVDSQYSISYRANANLDTDPVPPQAKTKGHFRVTLPEDRPLDVYNLTYKSWDAYWSVPLLGKIAADSSPIYTTSTTPYKIDICSIKTLPQEGENELGDPNQEYLLIDVKLTLTSTPELFWGMSEDLPKTSWFTLLDKEGFVVNQVGHKPQYVTNFSKMDAIGQWWRAQLYWAIPKGANPFDYTLRITSESRGSLIDMKLSDIPH